MERLNRAKVWKKKNTPVIIRSPTNKPRKKKTLLVSKSIKSNNINKMVETTKTKIKLRYIIYCIQATIQTEQQQKNRQSANFSN